MQLVKTGPKFISQPAEMRSESRELTHKD